VETEERRERGDLLVLVAEMVSLVFLVTPDPPDPLDLTDPLDLVETLLLRWLVVLMRSLVVPKWE